MVLMTHNTDIADSWEREGDDPRVLLQLLAERLRGRPQRRALFDEPLNQIDRALLRMTIVAILLAASVAAAQEQWDRFRGGYGRNRFPPRYPTATSFDGGFNFCRLMYTSDRREAGGSGLVDRLLGRRHQFLDAPRRADQDDDQPAGERQPQPLHHSHLRSRRFSSARS